MFFGEHFFGHLALFIPTVHSFCYMLTRSRFEYGKTERLNLKVAAAHSGTAGW